MPTRDFVSDVILATVKSWSFPYRGHVAEVLYDYQRRHNIPHGYTRLIPIVNSWHGEVTHDRRVLQGPLCDPL
jgi:hypothetical protein